MISRISRSSETCSSANSGNNSSSSSNSSRVWVRQAAIDACRIPATGTKAYLQRRASSSLQQQQQQQQQQQSFNAMDGSSHSVSETESLTDASSVVAGRYHLSWEWQEAVLLENSKSKVVVRLVQQDTDATPQTTSSSSLSSSSPSSTIELATDCWEKNQVVLANEYDVDDETGQPQPPHDLISLTHLHEPSVVESLHHRFVTDQIYTSTGPVLLAVNPFQTLRGLYGETIQRQYWERAEGVNISIKNNHNNNSGNNNDLPPHVYAIADESFRNMMRSLEDHLDDTTATTETATATATAMASSSNSCNQSILVSGESGAGKTVTTKFVMKYLAALSQRSVVLHNAPTRAYVKAKNNVTSPQRISPSKTKKWGGGVGAKDTSPWRSSSATRKSYSRSNSSSVGSTSGDLATVTTSLGGGSNSNTINNTNSAAAAAAAAISIEAQVLQSNPILESFGNARTVRNDNSSRFGKFIEIQFTNSGKLVGAQIDTYLLEKVRLVRQSAGERNYHIFYELLSGSMDAHELSQYFLAKTAMPEDFKLTGPSGTYDRRDGVSDRDTYAGLRTAMDTMKFSPDEVRSIFAVTAAILHASNLTFQSTIGSAGDEPVAILDQTNVHLRPVCLLLGVDPEDLSEALTAFSIQAGRENAVRRSLTVAQAEKGLEALLKTTYGALFTYLVQRINASIAFKKDGNNHVANMQPAASIGVLDIFGFESFHQNSFEQLCINYCNEALQQQFNAFVLKNEQAEYEREGIEWDFIEFPENQDVLDLIEKRGTGILSILDDQCRAPGPSDKAFAINVYNQCKSQTRFHASRKQTATLHFSVHHYAGPVEYTSLGFVEKNRDELPKETTEMLKTSEVPFVQDLAFIIEHAHEEALAGGGLGAVSTVSRSFHRADSSVGRATVGGQFRRQLRDLRKKIDTTTPHYIRCIKPNDLLVPDLFDRAIVAEQLKCGGILEAIRVARAGFTQHYPHSDFVRRYRSLAWKELGASKRSGRSSGTFPGWAQPPSRSNSYRGSYVPPPSKRSGTDPIKQQNQEKTAAEIKIECKQLIEIIYNKIAPEDDGERVAKSSPPAKAKTYSSTSRSTPSWSKVPWRQDETDTSQPAVTPNTKQAAWIRKEAQPVKKAPTPPVRKWRRGMTSADFLKFGLQMGKTKVFLRHKCFEKLERLRSVEHTKAATKLNSIFRRYLARIAYLPFRNAFRHELRERRRAFEGGSYDEKKESEYFVDGQVPAGFSVFRNRDGFACESLVDKWIESQIRDAIHNPVPRNEWGKQGPNNLNFLWVLDDGIWVKNYNADQSN